MGLSGELSLVIPLTTGRFYRFQLRCILATRPTCIGNADQLTFPRQPKKRVCFSLPSSEIRTFEEPFSSFRQMLPECGIKIRRRHRRRARKPLDYFLLSVVYSLYQPCG